MKTFLKQNLSFQIAFLGLLSLAFTQGPTISVAQSTSSADETGGTLTIGMSAGNLPYPNTPPNEGYEGFRFVGNNIFDALVHFDLDQGDTLPEVIPGLAESWEVSEDNLTWTFKLREGVTFHDGTPFNAEAVEFAFDRVIDQDFEYFDASLYGGSRAYTQEIESYQVVDEYTFEITTVRPYAFLLSDITHLFIPSPTVVQEYGNAEFINNAVGTGPFQMVRYVDGVVMELEANENYWGGAPKLDSLVLRPFPEPSSRLAALQSGDIDWAEVPPPDSLAQLEAENYNIQLKPYPHTIVMPVNTTRAPFDDVRVRQALQYAIDRENMCESLLNGACIPAYQYLYEGHPWYVPEFGNTYERDLDKARQLLAEAGYEDGLSIRMAYPTGGSGNMWPGPMMEFMQSNFREIGVEMEIVPLEWNNLIGIVRSGLATPENEQYDGFYVSWGQVAPSQLSRFATDRIAPNGCCNSMNYSNPELDAIYQAASVEFDLEVQNQLLRDMMTIVAEESPLIFVVHDLNLRVLDPKVQGFTQPLHWWAAFNNIWIDE